MKSPFSGNLILIESLGESFFTVAKSISFQRPNGETMTVKAGEGTDLYSVPKVLRSFVSALQPSSLPAIFHDAAYRNQWFNGDRKEADRLIVEVMQAVNLIHKHMGNKRPFSRYKMSKIYHSLRFGGWMAYRKHQ